MADGASGRVGLIAELKRRRVLRIGGAYLAGAFVVLQATDYLFRALLLPEWAFRVTVLLVLCGFVLALPLAWLFDVGPEGIRRTPPVAAASRSGVRTRLLVLGGAVIVAALAAAWLVLRPRSPRLDPRRLVVAPFANRTGDASLGPLGEMAADWITQGLTESGIVQVVDGSTALAIGRGSAAASGDAEDRVRLFSREAGAGLVITGRYYRQADSLQFLAHVVDARSGRILRAVGPVSASTASPVEGAQRLRQQILAELAALVDERLARFQPLDSRPPSFDAYREFMDGLARYLAGDNGEADARFMHAFALDTTFVRALLWAAQASIFYVSPGQHWYARHDSLAALVAQRRLHLSPAERNQFDYGEAIRRGNLRAAYAAARLRAAAAPGSDDALRELAYSALRVNRPRESMEVLQRLDPDRGLMRFDLTYWSMLATDQHMLGDFRGELQTAREAGRRRSDDVPTILRIRALAGLGRGEDVERLAGSLVDRIAGEAAAGGSADPRALLAASRAFDESVRELFAHGQRPAAGRLLQQALRWCDGRSDVEKGDARFRLYRADLLELAGRWRDADALLAPDPPPDLQGAYTVGRAVLAAKLGERTRALTLDRQLPGMPVGFPTEYADLSFGHVEVAAALGDRPETLRRLLEWRAAGDQAQLRLHRTPLLLPYLHQPEFRRLVQPEG